MAGHRGMVGSAIVRELQRQGYTNIITRTHQELDLLRQEEVERFFRSGWFGMLTQIDPEMLIRKLQEEVEE